MPRCCWDLWTLSEFLDLDAFPQISQGMEMPVMWLSSMWFIIAPILPSFPHTWHVLALPLPWGLSLSLVFIMDFTCWSKLSMSVLLVVCSVSTTAVSNVVRKISVSIWGYCLDAAFVVGCFDGSSPFYLVLRIRWTLRFIFMPHSQGVGHANPTQWHPHTHHNFPF